MFLISSPPPKGKFWISTTSFSSVSEIDVNGLALYPTSVNFYFDFLFSAGSAGSMSAQLSTDNGVNFLSGGSDYNYAGVSGLSGSTGGNGANSSSFILCGNPQSGGVSSVKLIGALNSSYKTNVQGLSICNNTAMAQYSGGGRASAEINNAIRFGLPSSMSGQLIAWGETI